MTAFTKIKSPVGVKTSVGLDIGSHAVKIISLSSTGDSQKLSGLALKTIQDGTKESLASAITKAVEESKISAKEVNISVSGPSVIVRFVSMPKMREDELKGAIRFEAEKFIPFNVNDCIVDSQILKRDEHENKIDIILVAAKRDHIQERISAVEKAGFSVGLVDVDGFALANSFLKNLPPPTPLKTFALLNIGAKFTNLSIITQGRICFVRDVGIGSDDFTSSISKGLGVDKGAAESLKMAGKEKLAEILSCTRPVINNLLDDVKLSFSYNENQCGRSIDEIYVSGGGSYLAGLDELFQETFGLGAPHHWNPLAFLDTSSAAIDKEMIGKTEGSFAVAAGLALR